MGTSVFRFCAIPQVMAAGTLALCFNNDRVFKGVVKMRRGATSKLMIQQRGLADVCRTFHGFMGDIAAARARCARVHGTAARHERLPLLRGAPEGNGSGGHQTWRR